MYILLYSNHWLFMKETVGSKVVRFYPIGITLTSLPKCHTIVYVFDDKRRFVPPSNRHVKLKKKVP